MKKTFDILGVRSNSSGPKSSLFVTENFNDVENKSDFNKVLKNSDVILAVLVGFGNVSIQLVCFISLDFYHFIPHYFAQG